MTFTLVYLTRGKTTVLCNLCNTLLQPWGHFRGLLEQQFCNEYTIFQSNIQSKYGVVDILCVEMSALSVLCRGLKLNRQQLPTIGGKGVAVAASASGNTSESPGKGNNEKRERRAEHSNKLEDCDVEDDHHSDSALSTDETDDECDKARNEDAGDGPTAANTVHRFCVKAGELRAMRKRDCTGPEPLATLDDLRSHLPASLFGTLGLVFHIKDLTLYVTTRSSTHTYTHTDEFT